jgi:hypothetical protein
MSDASSERPPGKVLLHLRDEELVIRQRYEVLSIINDLLIAVWFLIGSVLFFWDSTAVAGTWMFVLGSVQLMIRPAIRLHRRVTLQRVTSGTPAETARDF